MPALLQRQAVRQSSPFVASGEFSAKIAEDLESADLCLVLLFKAQARQLLKSNRHPSILGCAQLKSTRCSSRAVFSCLNESTECEPRENTEDRYCAGANFEKVTIQTVPGSGFTFPMSKKPAWLLLMRAYKLETAVQLCRDGAGLLLTFLHQMVGIF